MKYELNKRKVKKKKGNSTEYEYKLINIDLTNCMNIFFYNWSMFAKM